MAGGLGPRVHLATTATGLCQSEETVAVKQRPALGNGVIGGTGRISPPDASVIVTSSSIYVPGNNRGLVLRIVGVLTGLDYIGGIFLNDRFGNAPGSLSKCLPARIPTAAAMRGGALSTGSWLFRMRSSSTCITG